MLGPRTFRLVLRPPESVRFISELGAGFSAGEGPRGAVRKAPGTKPRGNLSAQHLSLNCGSASHHEVAHCRIAFVWAVGLHGDSLAALRSVRRTQFRRLSFTAFCSRSSGSRYARRMHRHVLVLSTSRASIGHACSHSGEYGNHRNLDRAFFNGSSAVPGNISAPARIVISS